MSCHAIMLLTFVMGLSDSVYNSIEHSTENVRVSYSIRLCTNGYNIHQFGFITMLLTGVLWLQPIFSLS